jgi:hypothetical protein
LSDRAVQIQATPGESTPGEFMVTLPVLVIGQLSSAIGADIQPPMTTLH